jgi:hypothetical protein
VLTDDPNRLGARACNAVHSDAVRLQGRQDGLREQHVVVDDQDADGCLQFILKGNWTRKADLPSAVPAGTEPPCPGTMRRVRYSPNQDPDGVPGPFVPGTNKGSKIRSR